ncbi:MAG: M28 family peptidase [bacterium]
MIDLSNKIINEYVIRKTKKQKEAFRTLLSENFECDIQKSFLGSNVIIGDVQKAKYIYTAHYDTPPKLPFPNLMTPKSLFWYIMYQVVICLMATVVMFFLTIVVFLIFLLLEKLGISNIMEYLYLGILFSTIIPLYVLLNGPPNKNNYNDNTSGVVSLIELMNKVMNKENCAFVFFDNEEKMLLGSRAFKHKYSKILKDKFLINIDCVSDGDHLFIHYNNKKTKELYKENLLNCFDEHEIKTIIPDGGFSMYPSDQAGYPIAIGIAFLRKNKTIGYYLDKIHTKKDICFDERNINYLTDALSKFNDTV